MSLHCQIWTIQLYEKTCRNDGFKSVTEDNAFYLYLLIRLDRKDTTMPHIHIFLQELDQLYHAGDLDQYYQKACQHAEHFFPGFTIAYAELYNSGISRLSDASLRHVLVPKPEMYNTSPHLYSQL
jgi:hypothetical protein